MRAYWEFGTAICDAGGLGYNFIYPQDSAQGLTFTVMISVPNTTTAKYRAWLRPFLEKLNALGIDVPIPTLKRSLAYEHNPYPPNTFAPSSNSKRAVGESVGHTLIASRFFPRVSFATPSALTIAHESIRHSVMDGNYTFHGMSYAPTAELSGNPDNAVNPAFRTTVLHAQMYEGNAHWDGEAVQLPKEELTKRHNALQEYIGLWSKAIEQTGGKFGSYINEGVSCHIYLFYCVTFLTFTEIYLSDAKLGRPGFRMEASFLRRELSQTHRHQA